MSKKTKPFPVADASPLFTSLIGPTIPVNTVQALGGVYARYESDFISYANSHWASDGSDWAQADYYDRALIYYAWWQRTGDATYLDRANTIAVDYRDDYLVANNYATSAHWSQIGGVALNYLVTGDEASWVAVGKVASLFAMPYYAANLGNTDADGMDNRVQARTIEAFLYAWKINAPADGHDWGALLRASLTGILASQSADGAYRFEGGVKPFMVGLLNDALIKYYDNFEADPRILDAVKKSLDYLWSHDWNAQAQAFVYLEGATAADPLGTTPAPDLNNMITSGFGWVYKMTGDAAYKIHGDMIFAGGVNGAWLDGSKQFNEEYTSSYKYLALTIGEPAAQAVGIAEANSHFHFA